MRLSLQPSLDPADYRFVHEIRVRFGETDAMGIVHHAAYLPYLEETRIAFLRSVGRPYGVIRDDGVDIAVLEAFVEYRRPLRFDDVVAVHLTIGELTVATFQIGYLLRVGDDVRATGVTVHGCLRADGRPTRLPTWMRELARG